MAITKEEHDQHAADYADEFNGPEPERHQMSDEEAFGLTEPAGEQAPAAEPEGAPGEEAAEPGAEAAAEPMAEATEGAPADAGAEAPPDAAPAADAAPSPADMEQRLKSWEGRLKARQAELDAREAAMGDSSVNEEQASLPLDDGGDGGEGYGDGGADDATEHDDNADPAAVLAEDFGADFVEQITRLVKKIASDCAAGVSATVDQVIADLQNERLQNHFNSIAATHADFMDVVESPEFSAWKAAQPDQGALQQVIDGGSARQIIDMLNAFKQSTHKADNPDYAGSDDDALDAAEGVRSSGVSLPQEPTASDDFAKAWNEA